MIKELWMQANDIKVKQSGEIYLCGSCPCDGTQDKGDCKCNACSSCMTIGVSVSVYGETFEVAFANTVGENDHYSCLLTNKKNVKRIQMREASSQALIDVYLDLDVISLNTGVVIGRGEIKDERNLNNISTYGFTQSLIRGSHANGGCTMWGTAINGTAQIQAAKQSIPQKCVFEKIADNVYVPCGTANCDFWFGSPSDTPQYYMFSKKYQIIDGDLLTLNGDKWINQAGNKYIKMATASESFPCRFNLYENDISIASKGICGDPSGDYQAFEVIRG